MDTEILNQLLATPEGDEYPHVMVRFRSYQPTYYTHQYGWDVVEKVQRRGGVEWEIIPGGKVRIDHAGAGHTPGLAKIAKTEANLRKLATMTKPTTRARFIRRLGRDGTIESVEGVPEVVPPECEIVDITHKLREIVESLQAKMETQTVTLPDVEDDAPRRGRGRG